VIGIAGASRTGKSTLTSYLKEYLQAKYTQEGQNDVETRVVVLHQDSYFRPQKPMFYLIPNQTPDGQYVECLQ
jgi:uridine kinase